jgi:hypothetical protein
MIFVKFMRVLVGIAVVWLLWRLLLPRGSPQGRHGSSRAGRRNKPHRKFVQSSVVENHGQAKEDANQ